MAIVGILIVCALMAACWAPLFADMEREHIAAQARLEDMKKEVPR